MRIASIASLHPTEEAMATQTPFPTSSAETPPTSSGMPGYATNPGGNAVADAARNTALDTDDLIGRIAQTAHETIDRLADTAAPHVSRLQESLSADTLHQRADQMRDMRDEWAESLRATVRENPLAAVGVALAVGVLVARLSSR